MEDTELNGIIMVPELKMNNLLENKNLEINKILIVLDMIQEDRYL